MLEHVPHVDGEVLNDEVVIIHSTGSAGKPEVFEPYTGIRLLDIFGDASRRSKALWERRSLDASAKGPWSRAIRAETPVGDRAWGAFHQSPRWSDRSPCRLLSLSPDGRHHHAEPDAGC